MKIRDILCEGRTISFEFFPPRAAEGIPNVLATLEELTAYSPAFVSVTYGAGGSTRAFTEEITIQAKRTSDVEVMAHLTCVGQTVEELDAVLGRLEEASVENVIALRGDPPRGETEFVAVEGGLRHASDLISHIRGNYAFGIAAACYPEGHTEAVDLDVDLEYARLKVENGAEFLITQLFYDNDDYFRFVERAEAAGINVPIIPGVLPVLSAPQIRRFTALLRLQDSRRPGSPPGAVRRRRRRREGNWSRIRHPPSRRVVGGRGSRSPLLRVEPQLLGLQDTGQPRPSRPRQELGVRNVE